MNESLRIRRQSGTKEILALLKLTLRPYTFPSVRAASPTVLSVRLMERIAANGRKVKVVSDCKWTEGKSHWRRFVEFVACQGVLRARRYTHRKNLSGEEFLELVASVNDH